MKTNKIKSNCVIIFKELNKFITIPPSLAELFVKKGIIMPTKKKWIFKPTKKCSLCVSIL